MNPFNNNYFCLAFIVFILLIIVNKELCANNIIENMPSHLGPPGMHLGTEEDNEKVWSNMPNNKTKKLKQLNEHFSCGLNESNQEELMSNEDNEYTKQFVDTYYYPDFYKKDENVKRLKKNKNVYNTGVYPEPINDRPDLSQCQPCPLKCEPCTTKKTILVHKLSPKLMKRIKNELRQ